MKAYWDLYTGVNVGKNYKQYGLTIDSADLWFDEREGRVKIGPELQAMIFPERNGYYPCWSLGRLIEIAMERNVGACNFQLIRGDGKITIEIKNEFDKLLSFNSSEGSAVDCILGLLKFERKKC